MTSTGKKYSVLGFQTMRCVTNMEPPCCVVSMSCYVSSVELLNASNYDGSHLPNDFQRGGWAKKSSHHFPSKHPQELNFHR